MIAPALQWQPGSDCRSRLQAAVSLAECWELAKKQGCHTADLGPHRVTRARFDVHVAHHIVDTLPQSSLKHRFPKSGSKFARKASTVESCMTALRCVQSSQLLGTAFNVSICRGSGRFRNMVAPSPRPHPHQPNKRR